MTASTELLDNPASAPPETASTARPTSGLEAALAEVMDGDSDGDLGGAIPAAHHWHGPLPEALMKVVDLRIDVWRRLLQLEQQRAEWSARPILKTTESEISRQNSELKRLPRADGLSDLLERLEKKLGTPPSPADGESLERPPDALDDWLDPAEAHRAVQDLGIVQVKLLIAREKLSDAVAQAARSIACTEPLFGLTARHGVDASCLIGWTFYALALEQRIDECRQAEADHRARTAEAEAEAQEAPRGMMAKLRRKPPKAAGPALDPRVLLRRTGAERELAEIERQLTEWFWTAYEDVAWLYAGGKLGEEDEVYARALLRYGLVAIHPGLIDAGKSAFILRDCTNNVEDWQNAVEADHVVYADEYIRAILTRQTTVSPDEDLELNERGSDRWKADRLWRQAVISPVKYQLYMLKREEVAGKAAELNSQVEHYKKLFAAVKEDPERKAEATAHRRKMTELGAEASRYQGMVDRLDQKLLPNLKSTAETAAARLNEAMETLPPEWIARREAKFIRRLARLAARLKEPYPQFVLRDNFDPDRSDHHHRAAVAQIVKKVEYADQYLFHEMIIPNKKVERRLSVRMAPTIVIAPGRGLLGFCINPRRATDAGKMMIPLLGQRQGALEKMVMEILSDFGWDCSMEEAGADWITADALVSAYANARWEYRSKNPETQKRAGFNKKNNDRQDWRTHYGLYVNSVEEAGKALFNKCFPVYQAVVKYIGLPPGIERLRKD